jgi:uncharacterized repeat protein (TIGR03803 family)
MSHRKLSQKIALRIVGTIGLLWATAAFAQVETVLHSFGSLRVDGYYPLSNLVFDKAGNLYGTTLDGGYSQAGTVFELSPKAGMGWTEKILHDFYTGSVEGTTRMQVSSWTLPATSMAPLPMGAPASAGMLLVAALYLN